MQICLLKIGSTRREPETFEKLRKLGAHGTVTDVLMNIENQAAQIFFATTGSF
jgi:hypothetical protein